MGATRKEIDKEYLFNLLMPTASSAPEIPEKSQAAPLKETAAFSLGSGARLRPARELVLLNLNEQLVASRLDEVFEKFRCCRCDRCRQDVAALALNALPARYVVAAPEDVPSLLEKASSREVSAALVKAILQVKKHPRH